MRTRIILALCLIATIVVGMATPIAREPRTIRVSVGAALQDAIDQAQPGDTIELENGATFVGNFTLTAKDGDGVITIRSAPHEDLPDEGMRVRPADAPLLAKLRSPNESPAVQTAARAHGWRLLLLEIGPNATPANDVIRFGDGSSRQRSVEDAPYDLEIDRCYIHGDAAVGQKRGLALNSGSARVVNSYFADFKMTGQDAQAIAAWNGPGPYQIVNNYLEAAGQNVLVGGADPAIPNLVPSDIIFRGNHVSKPTAWRGGRWQVKNLFELKNAARVLIEDNLFEHNWQAAQSGPALLFTPRNQDGTAPWSVVREVTLRRNVVRHVAAAINVLGTDSNNRSAQTSAIAIHHNLFVEVDARVWGGNGVFLLIGDGPRDVVVDHNTVMQSGAAVSVYGRPVEGFVFTNNVVRYNNLGIKGDARAPGNDSIGAYFPGGLVTHNAFAEGNRQQNPAGNHFPAHAVWIAQFRDYFGGDYTLTWSSTFRGAASDGSDLGVDFELLDDALAAPFGRRP